MHHSDLDPAGAASVLDVDAAELAGQFFLYAGDAAGSHGGRTLFACGEPARGSAARRGAGLMVSVRAGSEREAFNAASFMGWLELRWSRKIGQGVKLIPT
ncbi:hypothetical protein AA12717_2039 [Gluconacetobacter sacchari DSM 12717]|uniref:YCII-related domain-containing protein n=1 Tax=Gluconacetobacter sacchari DSM 12717 TaxID=1307940 RepID=A0ABQ0P7N1_9PROT|nr:hypothetical protein AA12717_2039 [Gluconacetobacter sacchari DSM 12717]